MSYENKDNSFEVEFTNFYSLKRFINFSKLSGQFLPYGPRCETHYLLEGSREILHGLEAALGSNGWNGCFGLGEHI
jgi:hypothetical protein